MERTHPHIDPIKVEIPNLNREGLEQRLDLLRRHNVGLLAEKVETEEEYSHLYDLGSDYFQDYFFSRPNVISGQRMEEKSLGNPEAACTDQRPMDHNRRTGGAYLSRPRNQL